jgi:chemotaxis protein methyltransferase CheR
MPYPFKKSFQAVFCRNVLYYFERDDQIATLRALHDVTEQGGWLLTSVTENVREVCAPWTPVANGVFRKGGA